MQVFPLYLPHVLSASEASTRALLMNEGVKVCSVSNPSPVVQLLVWNSYCKAIDFTCYAVSAW